MQRMETPVLENFEDNVSPMLKDVNYAYIKLALLIHPHRGGSFNAERADKGMSIVTRTYELANVPHIMTR